MKRSTDSSLKKIQVGACLYLYLMESIFIFTGFWKKYNSSISCENSNQAPNLQSGETHLFKMCHKEVVEMKSIFVAIKGYIFIIEAAVLY